MGKKRMGLARFAAYLENLSRKIDLNGTIFTDLKIEYYTSSLGSDSGRGEIVSFGSGSTVAGKTYYLHSDDIWDEVSIETNASGGLGMLATALGTSSADGMLLRGFFNYSSYLSGTFTTGTTVYLTGSGHLTTIRPSGSGETLRVAGTCTSTPNIIYFNPSADHIVVE